MNKDVIYIEPEDDITDIITKIEGSKEKIVALVPPKKSNVMRSIVNIKLISRAAASLSKTVVLVTTDTSIIKLAANTRMPVTKSLTSAPAIPTLDDIKEEPESESEETITEADIEEENDSDQKVNMIDEIAKEKAAEKDLDQKETEAEKPEPSETNKADSKPEKTKKEKKEKKAKAESSNPVVNWFQNNKKWAIIGGSALVVIILVLIWMFTIAPAVKITLKVKTTSNNFSETIKFTRNLEEEDVNQGVFYLEEKTLSEESKVEFNATGEKNFGNKASGSLTVSVTFSDKGSVIIPASATFTNNNYSYSPDAATTVSWDGSFDQCAVRPASVDDTCTVSQDINVVAAASGEEYNLSASTSGWTSSLNGVSVTSNDAITGGTTDIKTIVSQSDIDKATQNLKSDLDDEKKAKTKLLEEIDAETTLGIESSFSKTATEPVSEVAVGEVADKDKTIKLTKTTTATIYTIDLTKVKEYISETAKVAENNKIYKLGSPFVENFVQTETGYTGKLKTSFMVGPNFSETEILESVKGKLIGEVPSILKDAGASEVTVERSFFWVNSVPTDPNKITIETQVDENN